eukprot:CAMPEP_0176392292 /NCGR_PEP_ID=MMETSP0126-20121128/40741_1 /TAXON_ID=141414 ORGANISM="Strombidinopsis acuminatum, Strain SPMC142" /NCGR_SAMPLE_ID=MMETSP0126 /ASSEMBLY_ACC=CAM_ASM_000229 /LENGTH=157 /DNA_ID=CAMNT_0017762981 /DNA_START=1692 /DNA_END=2165 /DNA_ORIENTATION=+
MVGAKFTLLQANTNFMLRRYADAKEAAEKGLESLAKVTDKDPNVLKAIMVTSKDLKNVILRSRAKLEGVNALDLRKKIEGETILELDNDDTVSKKTAITTTAPVVPSAVKEDQTEKNEGDEEESEEEDDEKSQRAMMVFGLTSVASFGLTYMLLNKN